MSEELDKNLGTDINPETGGFADDKKIEDRPEVEEDKEFELTPEIEGKILEKMVAIGRERNLMGHGTPTGRLETILKYGVLAHEPQFSARYSGFPKISQERYTAGGVINTEAHQGLQSISLNDPWREIEIMEDLLAGRDHVLFAADVNWEIIRNDEIDLRSPEKIKLNQGTEEYESIKQKIEQKRGHLKVNNIYDITIPGHTIGRIMGRPEYHTIAHGEFVIPFEDLKKMYEQEDAGEKIEIIKNDQSVIKKLDWYGSRVKTTDDPKKWRVTLLIKPSKSDLEKGRINRSDKYEVSWESRIPKNRIIGLMSSNDERLTESIIFAQKMHIPIYDNETGSLLWPRQMSYEEVKQFVAERDKAKESEKTEEQEGEQ